MLNSLFWLLALVRDNILEGLQIPDLNMSYWDFCIYLAIASVVVTVLLNGVRVSGTLHNEESYLKKVKNREKARVYARDEAKTEIRNKGSFKPAYDIDLFEKMLDSD